MSNLFESMESLRQTVDEAGRTFLAARQEILDLLKQHGWALSPPLKIPHATSPSGSFRLWFKAQAVYFTDLSGPQYGRGSDERATRHNFGDARSIGQGDLDIRKYPADKVVAYFERLANKHNQPASSATAP